MWRSVWSFRATYMDQLVSVALTSNPALLTPGVSCACFGFSLDQFTEPTPPCRVDAVFDIDSSGSVQCVVVSEEMRLVRDMMLLSSNSGEQILTTECLLFSSRVFFPFIILPADFLSALSSSRSHRRPRESICEHTLVLLFEMVSVFLLPQSVTRTCL